MSKILLALLILLQLFVIPLLVSLVYALIEGGGNFSILLPGLGLVINGVFLLVISLITEIILLSLTIVTVRRLRSFR